MSGESEAEGEDVIGGGEGRSDLAEGDAIEVVERDTHAEDPAFVDEAVERLIALIEG